MVDIDRESFGVIVLGATVLTQTRTERIVRKIQKSKVGEAAKQTGFIANVLVTTGYKLIVISTAAAR